jgi:hypothetical protein
VPRHIRAFGILALLLADACIHVRIPVFLVFVHLPLDVRLVTRDQPSKRKSCRQAATLKKATFRFPSLTYSHSVAHTYKSVIAWAFSSRCDAKILYLACYSSSEAAERDQLAAHITLDLPSWAPDLQLLSHLQLPVISHPFQDPGSG